MTTTDPWVKSKTRRKDKIKYKNPLEEVMDGKELYVQTVLTHINCCWSSTRTIGRRRGEDCPGRRAWSTASNPCHYTPAWAPRLASSRCSSTLSWSLPALSHDSNGNTSLQLPAQVPSFSLSPAGIRQQHVWLMCAAMQTISFWVSSNKIMSRKRRMIMDH